MKVRERREKERRKTGIEVIPTDESKYVYVYIYICKKYVYLH